MAAALPIVFGFIGTPIFGYYAIRTPNYTNICKVAAIFAALCGITVFEVNVIHLDTWILGVVCDSTTLVNSLSPQRVSWSRMLLLPDALT